MNTDDLVREQQDMLFYAIEEALAVNLRKVEKHDKTKPEKKTVHQRRFWDLVALRDHLKEIWRR